MAQNNLRSPREFSQIYGECQTAHKELQSRNFITETGLKLQIGPMPESLRESKTHGLELFLVQQNAHHCLQEIGRLRERAFRSVGGGTHRELDLDHWDYSGFWQLLCIDTEKREICGAYRLLHSAQLCQNSDPLSPNNADSKGSNHAELGSVHSLFDFSPFMQAHILPRSIELGRSFVNEEAHRAHLALPLMFEGLGQIIAQNADFVIGKITFYPETLDNLTLRLLDSFFDYYWGEAKNPLMQQAHLAWPKAELDFRNRENAAFKKSCESLQKVLPKRFERSALHRLLEFLETPQMYGQNPKPGRAHKGKKRAVLRSLTLFLKYLSLLNEEKSGMHVFGGAVNPHFGNVVEFMSLVEVARFCKHYLQRWGRAPDAGRADAQISN